MGIEAASWLAREVDTTLLIIVLLEVAIWLGVVAVMIYFVVKYRRSKRDTTKQIGGILILEITWTVIPTLIVMAMFFVGYQGFLSLRSPPPGAMDVRVHAQRWYWSFEYPDRHVVSDELVLPLGRPAKLTITSADDEVLHSFYVPAFRIKEDAVPGLETYAWVEPDKLGTFNVFCAEFCGDGHAKMLSKVRVVPPDEFEQWMQDRVRGRFEPVAAAEALDADPEELRGQDGHQLFVQYCQACHGPEGRGGGPFGARNLSSLNGWKRGTKRSDVFQTITEGLPGTMMRPFRYLPVRERVALMHHVVSLAPGERPEPTAEDVARLRQRIPELDPDRGPQAVGEPAIPLEEAMKKVLEAP